MESNKSITLYNSFVTHKENMSSELEISTYTVNVALIGGLFDDNFRFVARCLESLVSLVGGLLGACRKQVNRVNVIICNLFRPGG